MECLSEVSWQVTKATAADSCGPDNGGTRLSSVETVGGEVRHGGCSLCLVLDF